jgi:hypothetical protein
MVLIGRSSDRSGERFMHVAIPTAIGAAGFVATAILKSPIPAMIALDGRRSRRLRHARTILGTAGKIPERRSGGGGYSR